MGYTKLTLFRRREKGNSIKIKLGEHITLYIKQYNKDRSYNPISSLYRDTRPKLLTCISRSTGGSTLLYLWVESSNSYIF